MAARKGVARNGRAVTRQDVLDAVGDLRKDLLDPTNPLSLYATIETKFEAADERLRSHIRTVESVAKLASDTQDELTEHKERYASDRGKVLGWAGAISAAASAVVKYVLPR